MKLSRFLTASGLLVSWLCMSVSSQSNLNDATFPNLLESIRKKHGVPSLAAVLIRDGAVVESAAVGERAIGSGVAVTSTDTYQLGSVSKSFTATMIARLVEQKVLQWDATLEQLFKGTPMTAAYRSVTLEQLLFHAGGFPADVKDRAPYDWNLEPQQARALYLEKSLTSMPIGVSGAQSVYSNMGYIVAALAVERATGKTWETLIREQVLEPLRMTGCAFGTRFKALTQPHGHTLNLLRRMVAVSPEGQYSGNSPVMYGADGLRCSLEDMSKYVLAHLSGARGADGLLSKTSFAFLHQPRLETQGLLAALGWFLLPNGLTWHNGSNTLNYAHVGFDPKFNTGFFVASNAPIGPGGAAVNEATKAISNWRTK